MDVRFATRQLERRYAQVAEAIRAWGPQVGPRYVTRINALRDAATIEDVGGRTLKDMGRVMAALKERYAGQMDFVKASALVKQHLG